MRKYEDVVAFSNDFPNSNYDKISNSIQNLEKRFKIIEKEYVESKRILYDIKSESEILIPISLFKDKELSALELIVRYLKEISGLKNKILAERINRDPRTTWATYSVASKKSKSKLNLSSKIKFPISIIKERKLSVLESIVNYLSKNHNFSSEKISNLLYRDEKTIQTILRRIKIKQNQNDKNSNNK
jgi:hypothetical protein